MGARDENHSGDHNLAFSTWSLLKLTDHLLNQGVVDDISHEGLRMLLHEEGFSFPGIKTWKTSTGPEHEAKKNRVLNLYAIADGITISGLEDPEVVICMDEFGPLHLQPRPGKQWMSKTVAKSDTDDPRRRRRATYKHLHGVQHLLA